MIPPAPTKTVAAHTLDDYFQTTTLGSLEKVTGNNLYGIRHTAGSAPVPINKDSYGLTFFTRPQLNMQGDNLRNVRTMYTLLTQNDVSIPRWVRCTLDPRLAYGIGPTGKLSSPLVDPLQAFIPVLSNNLQSMSGWPDIAISTFTSKAGNYQEEWSQVDGHARNYSTFDLDATFKNTKGDPVGYLMHIWEQYQSLVFEGMLVPYLDFITENRMDYNTRIYRLVLDADKRFVKKIAATGAAFPISSPMGQYFDYSTEKPYNDQSKDISIRFKCMGAIYNDDILIHEFNMTVQIFNYAMSDGLRASSMVLVGRSIVSLFDNRGYPRINPDTYELEWWVDKDLYNKRAKALGAAGLLDANQAANI